MKESTSMALTNEDNINSLKDILLIFPVLPGPPLPTPFRACEKKTMARWLLTDVCFQDNY